MPCGNKYQECVLTSVLTMHHWCIKINTLWMYCFSKQNLYSLFYYLSRLPYWLRSISFLCISCDVCRLLGPIASPSPICPIHHPSLPLPSPHSVYFMHLLHTHVLYLICFPVPISHFISNSNHINFISFNCNTNPLPRAFWFSLRCFPSSCAASSSVCWGGCRDARPLIVQEELT